MNSTKTTLVLLTFLLVPSLLIISSCVAPPPAPPVPEAVLAGNWSLTTNNPSNLPPTTLTFDSAGNLTNIAFRVDNATINQTPINGDTTVNSSQVIISQNLPNNSSLSFVGNLQADNVTIPGTLEASLVIGIIQIDFAGVPATMTRQ